MVTTRELDSPTEAARRQVAMPAIRPLQINSLFPVHRPHLVTASSKYSIIPYSSIIFRLFLHTDRLSKSYLETVSAHVSAIKSAQTSRLCYFCNLLRKEQA